jgi:hypothetical protein
MMRLDDDIPHVLVSSMSAMSTIHTSSQRAHADNGANDKGITMPAADARTGPDGRRDEGQAQLTLFQSRTFPPIKRVSTPAHILTDTRDAQFQLHFEKYLRAGNAHPV